jgi:hypothetical protein
LEYYYVTKEKTREKPLQIQIIIMSISLFAPLKDFRGPGWLNELGS